MYGVSWLYSKLINSARSSYNSKNYRSSRLKLQFIHFIYPTRNSFDLLARCNLRLKNFKKSRKLYRAAEQKSFELRDHNKNRFTAEIKSESFTGSYIVALRFKNEEIRNDKIIKIRNRLRKISEKERMKYLEEISQIGKLPGPLAKLLPWTPETSYEKNIFDNKHKRMSSEEIVLDRNRRELSRIKSSGAYQIMDHVSLSLHNPLKIIMLPISISSLIINLLRKRLGNLSNETGSIFPIDSEYVKRDCIVLFPTNGVGFGHFTRMLALAKSIKNKSRDTEIVFFTTMPTLHIVAEEGFIAYHMPGRYRYDSMEPKVWNTLCEELLNLIFLQHSPSHFIFDGAYPYRGMLNSISNMDSKLTKIWLKRGSIKTNVKKLPVDSYDYFDAILRPGDSTENDFSDEFDHGLKLKEVGPMMIYDQSTCEPIMSLRTRLDIPKNSVLAYVQLGAGKINNIDDTLGIVLKTLSKYPQCYVVMAESLIGERLKFGQERLRLLRDFPNSRWFKDIDFAIMAGGYNSYHEMVEFCIPSIIMPNTNTGRDDQVARINNAMKERAMVMLKKPDKLNIELAIDRIMEDEVRSKMSSKLNKLRKNNGAIEAAEWILQL